MSVVAKFRVQSVTGHEGGSVTVQMYAVCSSDPNHPNKAFSDATPSGQLTIGIQGGRPAVDYFHPGSEYFLNFTKDETHA